MPRRGPASASRQGLWGRGHDQATDTAGNVLDAVAIVAACVLVVAGILNEYAVSGRSVALREASLGLLGLALLLLLRATRVGSGPAAAWATYAASVVLLAALPVVGVSVNGARRWLAVGPLRFEPSELAALGLLLVLAQVLGGTPRPGARRIPVAIGVAAVPIALTAVEPDLSTALLLAALTVTMLVLGRVRGRALVPLLAAVVLVTPLAVSLLRPYQLSRVQGFLHGSGPGGGGGSSFTIHQAKIAIASGGLFGQARHPLHGLLALYLPGAASDLALDSTIEQWGLVSGAAVLAAAVVLIWRLALAGRVARTRPEGLVAAGLAVLFGVESVVSAGGNLGVLPLAGVPFPLLSLGGSAIVVDLAAVGIALSGRRNAALAWLWLPPRWSVPRPRWVRLGAFCSSGLLALLGFYGWRLQSGQGVALRLAGHTEMTRCVDVPALRGEIVDRHGSVLALDAAEDRIEVVPSLLLAHPVHLADLAHVLGQRPSSLRSKLQDNRTAFALSVATVPYASGRAVGSLRIPEVVVVPSQTRVYPYGPLLAPVLGYVGVASATEERQNPGLAPGAVVGRSGTEEEYDSLLRGVDGQLCLWVSPAGTPVAVEGEVRPVPGAKLVLSIDLGLQQQLTAALASATGAAGSSGGRIGAAVAMDPQDGQVLAMASLPSYDDNLWGPPLDQVALGRAEASPGDPMLEHATQTVAPPGSTFKLVVGSADTAYGVVPPTEVVVTGGSYTFAGHTYANWSDLPPMNLTEAIGWSNDVYFYKLAVALGADRIDKIGAQLGVGRATGLDLPGEDGGYLGSPAAVAKAGGAWYAGTTVILGIGQGQVEVTPLQDARWTAAVSTGRIVTPYLGLAVVVPGSAPERLAHVAAQPLAFASSLGPVQQGMVYSATKGIATAVANLPVTVGAKTGTAQDPSNPGGQPDAWFTAAAPMPDPAIVVTALVRGGGEGDATAGPVVDSAMQYFVAHEAQVLSSGG